MRIAAAKRADTDWKLTLMDFTLPTWLQRAQVFFLFSLSAFVTFSIAGTHVSLSLLLASVLGEACLRRRRARNPEGDRFSFSALALGIELPLFSFATAVLISTLLSDAPRDSLWNMRHLLEALAAYATAYALRAHPAFRLPVLYTFLGAATCATIWGLIEYAMGVSEKVQSTQATTMTWAAMCAMFTLVTLQFALSGRERRDRWLARLSFVPQFLALLLSYVRGGYLGFTAGAVYLVRRYWKRILPIAALVLLTTMLATPARVRDRAFSIWDLKIETTQVRLTQWKYGVEIFADHPLFGVGWRDLAPLTRQYATDAAQLSPGLRHDVLNIGHYHSNYVTVAVCFGGVGLVAFLWMMVAIWRQLSKAEQPAEPFATIGIRACKAAFISFLVAGVFDWTFGDAEVATMLWYLVGLGLGFSQVPDRQNPT